MNAFTLEGSLRLKDGDWISMTGDTYYAFITTLDDPDTVLLVACPLGDASAIELSVLRLGDACDRWREIVIGEGGQVFDAPEWWERELAKSFDEGTDDDPEEETAAEGADTGGAG